MKFFYYLLFLFFSIGTLMLHAQSTIGADIQPQDFSILEIISGNSDVGGLRMPQLTEGERTALTNSAAFQSEKEGKAMGLTIYNKTNDCIEYWNGTKWVSRCEQICCAAPSSPCPITFSVSRNPLWLNDTFTASVTPVAGLFYNWEVPSSMSIVGSSSGSSVTIRVTSSGTHLLSGINVRATNDCGGTSICSGSGSIRVLDCDRGPNAADINFANIKVDGTKSGTGSYSDPYDVETGDLITITYQNVPSSTYYMWSLDSEGQNYFDLISSDNGIIVLRAKNYNAGGNPCSGGAIRLTLLNECGSLIYQESGIRVRITSGCIPPAAPGQITVNPISMLAGSTFTASIASVAGATSYNWSLTPALAAVVEIQGAATTSTITLKVKATATAGTYDLSGLSVSAVNGCGTSSATQGSGTLTVTDMSGLPVGTGSLQGKTCFDIAYSNNNSAEGFIDNEREHQRTDFTKRSVQDQEAGTTSAAAGGYSGVQVYTFTTSGNVSNVRFVVNDPNGAVLDYTPVADYSGTLASGTKCKLTVSYNPDLNDRLRGVARTQSWKVDIYAIYHDGVSDKQVQLTASLRDASCCGAATTSGGWLVFMCHNLGVDQNLDPTVHKEALYGDYYQWGRQKDGHEKQDSKTILTLATNNSATTPSTVTGRFILAPSIPYDWRSGSGNTARWGNGTSDENPAKANNDPCPTGWKVPSQKQWRSIYSSTAGMIVDGTSDFSEATANTWTWKNYGVQIGNELYLPAAGYRFNSDGCFTHIDYAGHYWSATIHSRANISASLQFANSIVGMNFGNFRAAGRPVRCVVDDSYIP